jgi:hypothetical protein
MVTAIFIALGVLAVAVAIWMFVTNARLAMWDFVTILCPIALLATASFSFYCAILGAPKVF